ncbi:MULTISPECIES: LCP family protein [Streptomyces]|uniref:LytR family transcriptional regulator n=1 Tax=Streptomyces venezuelae TaxID=54571 RepID=A0A5P2BAR3_STRVZ|nr:LCP family protein [Streptomyces venezuelae]MYY82818.1 LytR family transcriptional regulator [Streptomyces sp. SID335]MYZ16394.1 LytR family transcriptional regulator [Streptomyces sp. SID337]NDZ87910.1 LCP family protein [Streptomyces sp. SID10115]NEA01904.1 LCP family protein [Streptomyces sp. SID10116]NEB44246.1 LCP family protein [Streptomyces sp. SID339]
MSEDVGSHSGGGDSGAGAPHGPGAGASASGVGRRRRWARYCAVGVAVVVLGVGGLGWAAYQKLNGNITTDTDAAAELARYDKERPTPLVHDAQNILLLGSDTRAGQGNRKYGRDPGTERSDTTILLHLAADRRSATAVSIPRDLMVDIPSCRKPDGSRTQPQFAQFNWAFEFGGTACTIRTVEKLTDIRVDHHMVVDFAGFKDMVDAVDGVQVCLRAPIDDSDAHVKLAPGLRTLNGEQALGFVRARKSLGNGSDTDRMDRQQEFLGALVNKVQSNDVLLNPTKLYPVLDAATSSLTTDPGLASLRGLYELVRGMRNIPTERVQFLTVPRQSYTYDVNRDELVEPAAKELFARLRADAPVTVDPRQPAEQARQESSESAYEEGDDGAGEYESGDEKPDDPSETPSPAPTFRGNTAARSTCE